MRNEIMALKSARMKAELLLAEAKMGELLEKVPSKYSLGSPGRTKTLPPNITKKQSHYAQEFVLQEEQKEAGFKPERPLEQRSCLDEGNS